MSAADCDWAEAAQGRPWSTSVAEKVLRAFADSGLSRVEFATRHGIHEQRLYQWQRRLSATLLPDRLAVSHPEVLLRAQEAAARTALTD